MDPFALKNSTASKKILASSLFVDENGFRGPNSDSPPKVHGALAPVFRLFPHIIYIYIYLTLLDLSTPLSCI